MIKIAISKAEWAQNVSAGGDFAKSLMASKERGVKLWYLGHGVLVEHKGKPDRLIPIANVLTVESDVTVSAEEWAGGQPAKLVAAVVAPVVPSRMSEEPTPAEPKRSFGRKKGLS